jgi:hypothetical protein
VDFTAGRSKAIWTLELALRGAWTWLAAVGADAGAASFWAGALAAFAAMLPVKASPDAARITAAWRPSPPALAVTARDADTNGFERPAAARRARVKRDDMKEPLPMPAR